LSACTLISSRAFSKMSHTVRKAIHTSDAPLPFNNAPYNQGIIAGNLVFTSGALGIDPSTGKLVPGGIKAETEQAFKNLSAILKTADSDLSKVVKTTVLLANIADFAAMNEVYKQSFGGGAVYPARSAFQAGALPGGAQVEIEAIAIRGPISD